MSQELRTPQKHQADSPQAAIRAAEERAERAEKKLESLEQTVAELKRSESTGEVEGARRGQPRQSAAGGQDGLSGDPIAVLRAEPMMAHLMDSLEAGADIGHYGRLVFAIIAHHFLTPEQVTEWLTKDRDFGEEEARALMLQVKNRDYSPPRRERILGWQAQQSFPILPNIDDPDCGNVYRNLKFPDKVYEHIQDYQEEKAEAASQ